MPSFQSKNREQNQLYLLDTNLFSYSKYRIDFNFSFKKAKKCSLTYQFLQLKYKIKPKNYFFIPS